MVADILTPDFVLILMSVPLAVLGSLRNEDDDGYEELI